MTFPASDDGWDELARELGLDKPSATSHEEPTGHSPTGSGHTQATSSHESEDENSHPSDWANEQQDGEAESDLEDTEGEEGDLEPETGSTVGSSDDGQGGVGRKRRRRRRRRKKGATGEEAEPANAEVEEAAEPEPTPVPVAQRPRQRVPVALNRAEDFGDIPDAMNEVDEDHSERPIGMVEEDTAGEVLRELIATWNVPSWDEIITGLYRPER